MTSSVQCGKLAEFEEKAKPSPQWVVCSAVFLCGFYARYRLQGQPIRPLGTPVWEYVMYMLETRDQFCVEQCFVLDWRDAELGNLSSQNYLDPVTRDDAITSWNMVYTWLQQTILVYIRREVPAPQFHPPYTLQMKSKIKFFAQHNRKEVEEKFLPKVQEILMDQKTVTEIRLSALETMKCTWQAIARLDLQKELASNQSA